MGARPGRLRAWGLTAALVAGFAVPAGMLASSASAATQAGSCNGFSGAVPLGASYKDSAVTVPACGPQPYLGGKTTTVYPYAGGRAIPGYQCVELSERYLYYKYGVKALGATNGDQVVDHYAAWYPSLFRAIPNGTARQAPVEGDVLSFSDVSTFNGKSSGHTAVVQSSSVNSSGNGPITIIEENGGRSGATGSQVLQVSGWKVQYSPHPYVKWLHRVSTPKVTLPAEPTNPKVKSTTASSAVLAWTDASNNESDFVTQYRIGSGSWAAGPTVGAGVTSVTVGGLKASTGYTFQVGARNAAGTHWSAYFSGTTAKSTPPPPPPSPATYHTGRQVTIDQHATGGVSGHKGAGNSYTAGPTRPANSALWIVCYVTGQSIKGPYDTTTMWDLSDDGYYYTDAWIYTGTNGAVVPKCAPKSVTVDKHATGGLSGHKGPDNSYSTGPTHAVNSALTIECYVTGQSIKGPYDTTTMWDLSDDGYYYSDAWIYTGTNGAVVPHC